MSIRTKLLILLLVITLPSLLLLSLHSISGLQGIGDRLMQLSEQRLVEHHRLYLQEKIALLAQLLKLKTHLVIESLKNQAQAVELALTTSSDQPTHPLYLSDDFDDMRVPLTLLERYRKEGQPDNATLPISLELPVFLLDEDTTRSPSTQRQLNQLSRVTPVYKRHYDNDDLLSLWHYTSLASGIHMSFPGHGGYPQNYDPSSRQWYKGALQNQGIHWSGASIDATSGKLVLTASMPVYLPDATVAGVTAMDIVISELLKVNIGAQDWLQNAKLLILEKGALEQGLKIFAKQDYRDAHRVWNQAVETETLFANEPEHYQRLVGLNAQNPFTILELARETGNAMMAVTPILHDETFLAVVFPQADLLNSLSRANGIIVEERDRKIREELVAIITVLGIIFIAAVWISRRVTGDLQKISHTAGEIAEGRLQSRTAVLRKDEIGHLAGSIDIMADAIEALQEEQESSYMQMLHSLTRALEKKDSYTAAHSGRVAKYSVMLGRRLGLDEQTLKLLKRAALMHDLGKIGIADAVLNKPASLDDEEFSEMRLHPSHGKTIMRPLVRFKEFAQIAAWHHEHWDGSGYPDGLKGDEIPLLARIVSIADSWDAMIGDRVYRKGMSPEKALEVLKAEKHSGQWDPRLLTQFIAMVREEKREMAK